MGHCLLKRVMEFPQKRLEIMSQKKEAWCGETGGGGGWLCREMSTISFKYPQLLPINSVPLHLFTYHMPDTSMETHTVSHLTVVTTLRDGHFFNPHYADKTEARALLPKSTELIRGRAGTQTKRGKSTI